METKQVIVIRKDLNMRKGKMISQGCHASMAAVTKYMETDWLGPWQMFPTPAMKEWFNNSFTKICVYVKSEKELKAIYEQAVEKELPCSLIKDNGKTEFKEPTYTAVAVGPAEVEEIDEITGDLPLL